MSGPGPGSEQPRHGPLAGVRVLELAGIGPAPFCAMMLADAGATVLRIDRPAGRLRPEQELLNRGRRSAVLDLKHPRAVDALLRLIDAADVLLEGFRPGVTERLGAGPDVCLGRNPLAKDPRPLGDYRFGFDCLLDPLEPGQNSLLHECKE